MSSGSQLSHSGAARGAASRVIAIVDLQSVLAAELSMATVLERALEQKVGAVLLRAKGVEPELARSLEWARLIEVTERSEIQLILHESVLPLVARTLLDPNAMDSTALDRRAFDSSALDRSSLDSGALDKSRLDRQSPDSATSVGSCEHWSAATLWKQERILTDAMPNSGAADEPGRSSGQKRRKDRRFGVSAHSLAELELAESAGASWAFLSPYMPTESKPGYGPTLGLTGMEALCHQTSLPVFALAGVNAETVLGLGATGAAGVAVMGMLTQRRASEELQRLFQRMEDEPWSRQIPW